MYFESDLSCFSSPICRMCFPDLACSLSLIWRHLASVAGVSLTLSFSVFAHVLASFGITYFGLLLRELMLFSFRISFRFLLGFVFQTF